MSVTAHGAHGSGWQARTHGCAQCFEGRGRAQGSSHVSHRAMARDEVAEEARDEDVEVEEEEDDEDDDFDAFNDDCT